MGCLGILFVLALILGVVFVVVDGIVAGAAEAQVAKLIRAEAEGNGATPSDVSVDIEGFPFLTQAARSQFDAGHIVLTDLSTKSLTVQKVDVTLAGLHVPRDVMTGAKPHDVVVDRVRGTATVALAEVQKGIGAPNLKLSGAGDTVTFSVPVPLPGFALIATGSAKVRLKGDRVWLEITEAKANGVAIPKVGLDAITRQLSSGAKLPALPLGLKVTGISLSGSTVNITAAADKVQLA